MKFILRTDDKIQLEKIVKFGMALVSISQRASILLKKADNMSNIAIPKMPETSQYGCTYSPFLLLGKHNASHSYSLPTLQ